MLRELYDRKWSHKVNTERKKSRDRWYFVINHVPSASSVLDIGCGIGLVSELLIRRKACHVIGTDVSLVALRDVDRSIPVCLTDINAINQPFKNQCFDVVILSCVLEHLFDPVVAVQAAMALVRPYGRVIIVIPNAAQYQSRLNLLFGNTTPAFHGTNIKYYNFHNEFENFVLNAIPNIVINKKVPLLRDSQKLNLIQRLIYTIMLRYLPNLAAAYTGYIIQHLVQESEFI